MKKQKRDLIFSNIVIDKKQLKQLIVWAFRNYGIARAANMADKLKDLGFYYATKAGISLSLEDLKIPPVKRTLLKQTVNLIIEADNRYQSGEITAVERFQKVIDTWNNASEMLKKEVIRYFKAKDPLNSIYMMAFSGARGNISQVRQLVGMRGLMSDPQGQIIDLPISSNFREGLTVTDYFISSYGARKGLVDTALRTADSGYLTRRLVDVAQDVIIREVDCQTSKGILLENVLDNNRVLISLSQALVGRLLAEDLFHPRTGILIAQANQDINDILAEKIVKAGIKKVLVRSPITCNAHGSVCQKCYGWNLAHGKLVDLGEAVGIIAAQSIGEPGTQLTMRTFHTGGVFTGEFAEKIYAPCHAVVKHPDQNLLLSTRTRHGDPAYLVQQNCSIYLYAIDQKQTYEIRLGQNSLLLVEDNVTVMSNQLIAEYPLKSRLVTEKARKSILADIEGKVCFTDLMVEQTENQQHLFKSAQLNGLIWVLSSQVYSIPDGAELVVKTGDMIRPNSLLAITKIVSNYSGYVHIIPTIEGNYYQEILIVVASQILANVKVNIDRYYTDNYYILEMYNRDKFLLKVNPNEQIINKQIIGELISDVYKTSTGGIIKYLDLPVSKKKYSLESEYYNILGAGYILWISEETHEINKDVSLLLVNHGNVIEKGTEIIKNIFSQNSGIVEIVEKDSIVKEVIIKPCTVYGVDDGINQEHGIRKRGFLRPGQKIIKDIVTNKLVYWEYLNLLNKKVLLVRPVVVYSIPKKNYIFEYTNSSFRTDALCLSLNRRIDFKDGSRVKSVQGVDLIKTYLAIEIAKDLSNLTCSLNLIQLDGPQIYLKFTLTDTIVIKENVAVPKNNQVFVQNNLLVENKSFIQKNYIVAQTELLSSINGQVIDIEEDKVYSKRLSILTDVDKYVINVSPNDVVKVKMNDWVYKNQEILQGHFAVKSGKVIFIDSNNVVLRIGRPYLISKGSILHIDHGSLIKRGESIATLLFDRAKTGDIVQGLPRIEEILEARKKVDSNFNPHMLLEHKFRFYLNLGLTLSDATRISVQEIQLLLVKEVQLVYQSQGVDISDKHIEVIIKQMTSKVKIENGGDTNHLPGEIVDLQKIEAINKGLSIINKQMALYHPILLGITKASLNTESFISAASFQETTKVLTEAAISGKLDWLRGLKENVIIGRLIPAGTGFSNCNFDNHYSSSIQIFNQNIGNDFEDIILDDRGARNWATNFKQKVKDLQPNTDII